MGMWTGYSLSVGPGVRDLEAVAADLRVELAAADIDEYTVTDEDVSCEDGIVRWTTGENHGVAWGFWEGLVPALDVPAEWALGVYQQEVEWNGGATLYAWLDDGFAEVETFDGAFGRGAQDAIAYFEREYDVVGTEVA